MSTGIDMIDRIPVDLKNSYYIGNREPLHPLSLLKLPIGCIKPDGWLKECLIRQANGLSGHLDEISAWLQKKDNAWLSSKGKGKWGWEEVPYWLRGYLDLGIILDDPKIKKNAFEWIHAALNSTRKDGDFGPDLRFKDKSRDFWANMIMLNCLQSYYEYSEDPKVLDLMQKYFHYQNSIPDAKFLTNFWQKMRGGDNLYSVFWLYNRREDPILLDLAHKIHRNTANWLLTNDLPNWHNVNIAQGFREPATYYLLTKDPAHLKATYDDFNEVRRRYGQVPGGMWGGDENSRPGYDDPRQGIETCGIVEHMFSDEILMGITGDPKWADHCEEIAFNTLPAAIMPDFKALRYLTCPNMVISDDQNHHPGIDNKGPFLLMNPFSSRCCQHNHGFGWPYYSEYLWMATPDNGACVMLYSASNAKIRVGTGQEVEFKTETNYPFEENILITLNMEKSETFPLYLRIPDWCAEVRIQISSEQSQKYGAAGKYLRIEREWKPKDQISLVFNMKISVKTWEANKNSLTVSYGPLSYSLKINEKYVKVDSTKAAIGDSKWVKSADKTKWPSFEILPGSTWNYGVSLDNSILSDHIKIIKSAWSTSNFPFTQDSVPISLLTNGYEITNWKIDQYGLCGILPQSPVKDYGEEAKIELIPMGASRLRITAFPRISK